MPLNAPPNPAWPLLRVLWSPTSNGTYDMDAVHYTDITRRCLKQWSVSRGRGTSARCVLGTYSLVSSRGAGMTGAGR